MSRRIFTACLGTETNSFSPIPTGMSIFETAMLVRGGQHGDKPSLFAVPLVAWRERAQALGWHVVEGLAAFAMPAGDTTRATYEALRDEVLDDLRRALPVDAVLLNLHGAMIAEGYPDAEGDLLARVREAVGPQVPIAAELDLHGHLTELKLRSADILVFFKEYPHIDVADRAHEVFELLRSVLDGEIRPAMAMHDCRMLGVYPTTAEPMKGIVARMRALESEPGILSVSIAHGFPWGDTPEVGTRTLVVADGDPALAGRVARELGRELWDARERILPPFVAIDEAIDRVLTHAPDGRPFVLADVADNPGIGCPGDSTFLLRRLIERAAGGFALSPLWDPVATALAFDAGEGAVFDMRFGGKMGPCSGEAIDARIRVMRLVREGWQPFGGTHAPLGNMAWLRIAGPGGYEDDAGAIDVVINDYRIQSFHPDCFAVAGIDPARPRALVAKSTQHFHAGFAPIAREILYVSAPGAGSMDMATLPHRRVERAMWPRVEDPHA
ncbi:MAG: M81 family metallopeptidase [Burkholderiales bacterium]|nr:MAG: M81 family metallopeptidase [Burkholderiales bacterium]